MIDLQSIKTPDAYEAVFGRIVPRKSKPAITIVCEMCGSEATVSRDSKRFCDAKCRAKYNDIARNPRINQLVTTSEAAQRLGVSVSTVRNRIRLGQIKAHRIGHLLLVHKSSVGLPVENMPVAVASALTAFVSRHGLSIRDLARILEVSKTTAHRLMVGTLQDRRFQARKAALTERLTAFLLSKKMTASSAAAEISTIFG